MSTIWPRPVCWRAITALRRARARFAGGGAPARPRRRTVSRFVRTAPLGVNVAGYLDTESGMGEAARASIRSLDAAGIPFALNNVPSRLRKNDRTYAAAFGDVNPHPFNLVHLNADNMGWFADGRGKAYFANRYTIIERIGSGGMGVVYKAIDTMLDGEVALKLMQPALAQMPAFIERFRREVRITRQIAHPNICRFHDIGEFDAVLYVSMEWIEGETLRQLLEQTGTLRDARRACGAQSIDRFLEVTGRLLEGLLALHHAGAGALAKLADLICGDRHGLLGASGARVTTGRVGPAASVGRRSSFWGWML